MFELFKIGIHLIEVSENSKPSLEQCFRLNSNLGDYEKRIVQGNPFTGIDSLYVDGKKTRLYVSNKGNVSLYTSASDNDSSWVKKGDVITNADLKVTLKNGARLEIYSDVDTSYIDSFSGDTHRHRLVWSDGGLTLYKYSGNTNVKIWSSY